MVTATNTTEGQIVLGGDLTGSADAPELISTGIIPGTYSPVQRMYVDAKGRVVSVGTLATGDILAVLPIAGASTLGLLAVGSGFIVQDQTLSAVTASIAPGVFSLSTGISISAGVATIKDADITNASAINRGYIRIGDGLSIDVNGITDLNYSYATTSSIGIFSANASDFTALTGAVSLRLSSGDTIQGVVSTVDTGNVNIETGGAVNVGANIVRNNIWNTYNRTRVVLLAEQASSTSLTPDFTLSGTILTTVTGATTVNVPTGTQAGGVFTLMLESGAATDQVITMAGVKLYGGATFTIAAYNTAIITFVVDAISTYALIASNFS